MLPQPRNKSKRKNYRLVFRERFFFKELKIKALQLLNVYTVYSDMHAHGTCLQLGWKRKLASDFVMGPFNFRNTTEIQRQSCM